MKTSTIHLSEVSSIKSHTMSQSQHQPLEVNGSSLLIDTSTTNPSHRWQKGPHRNATETALSATSSCATETAFVLSKKAAPTPSL